MVIFLLIFLILLLTKKKGEDISLTRFVCMFFAGLLFFITL